MKTSIKLALIGVGLLFTSGILLDITRLEATGVICTILGIVALMVAAATAAGEK